MLPPVRCFTCGKPIGGRIYREFKERVAKGEDPEKVFEDLGIKRYCCRMTLFTSENYFEEILPYTTVRTKQ
ncbi:MAG: DNA-directed polymerase subunit [Candidatus Diapherotrites archaeon]|nr:DNA-directed polymerase subunit [Candidatus Diapherotrites archaeon]